MFVIRLTSDHDPSIQLMNVSSLSRFPGWFARCRFESQELLFIYLITRRYSLPGHVSIRFSQIFIAILNVIEASRQFFHGIQ